MEPAQCEKPEAWGYIIVLDRVVYNEELVVKNYDVDPGKRGVETMRPGFDVLSRNKQES